jgi:hypothetical protein
MGDEGRRNEHKPGELASTCGARAQNPHNPHLYFFFTISDTTSDAAMACESASMVRAAAVIGLLPLLAEPGVGPGVPGVAIFQAVGKVKELALLFSGDFWGRL